MKVVVEDRASIIIYNILLELKRKYPKLIFFLPANICPIVPATFLKAGVEFKFIDIDPVMLNIDLEVVNRFVKERVFTGLLFSRYIGNSQPVENEFKKLKSLGDVFIIDDKCACVPEFKLTSEFSDLTLFSTGYAKYVELGYGGYAYLNTDILSYERNDIPYCEKDHAKLTQQFNECLTNQTTFTYNDSNWLGNTECSHDFSEYKRTILSKLERINVHKAKLNAFYSSHLPQKIQYPTDYQNWRFNIKVKNKQKILERIFESGLFASSHYASISHLFSGMKSVNAENLYAQTINLFNDYRFDLKKAKAVTDIINDLI